MKFCDDPTRDPDALCLIPSVSAEDDEAIRKALAAGREAVEAARKNWSKSPKSPKRPPNSVEFNADQASGTGSSSTVQWLLYAVIGYVVYKTFLKGK
mgnify:CR=1 FL=1